MPGGVLEPALAVGLPVPWFANRRHVRTRDTTSGSGTWTRRNRTDSATRPPGRAARFVLRAARPTSLRGCVCPDILATNGHSQVLRTPHALVRSSSRCPPHKKGGHMCRFALPCSSRLFRISCCAICHSRPVRLQIRGSSVHAVWCAPSSSILLPRGEKEELGGGGLRRWTASKFVWGNNERGAGERPASVIPKRDEWE
jgi:hypothetical protein